MSIRSNAVLKLPTLFEYQTEIFLFILIHVFFFSKWLLNEVFAVTLLVFYYSVQPKFEAPKKRYTKNAVKDCFK